MPQERLAMAKILEILRLHYEQRLSGRVIARSVCCALSTVQDCLQRFAGAGLVWPVDVDEAALLAALYPKRPLAIAVDYAAAVTRLSAFKGITRERVWQEYREREPEGISYSAFCAGVWTPKPCCS